jgi:hypothetical protein
MMRSFFITLLAAIALLNKRADAAGTLVLTVADSQTIPKDADTVVTIALKNPAAAQAAVTPTIAASVEGTPTSAFGISAAAMTGSTVLATQATFTASVAESLATGTAVVDNVITFTIQPSKALVATQKITIAGLTGADTADNAALAVDGAGKALVGSQGVWTQNTGTLVLTVAGNIPTGSNTLLTIKLKNPAAAQAAVTPTIAASVEGTPTSAFGISAADMVAPSASSGGGDSGGSSSDDNTGAIVGGVIGGLVVVAIVVYLVMNQRKK